MPKTILASYLLLIGQIIDEYNEQENERYRI